MKPPRNDQPQDEFALQRAEAALRESQAQLRELSANLADGMVYQIDAGSDGRQRVFSYLSPAVERFHGLSVEAAQRDSGLVYAQIVEEDRAPLAEAEARAFASKTKLEIDVRVRMPSGEIRWRRFVSSPRRGADGHWLWDGIEVDVTQRRLREREADALRSQRIESLGLLAGGIAHDFNNLLVAIEGNASLLAEDLRGDPEKSEMLREIALACQSARGLSRQLLTFASGGEPVIGREDLAPLIREAAIFAVRGTGVRCAFTAGDKALWAKADKEQIIQMAQNLALNAVQAMPLGGTLSVTLARTTLAEGDEPPLPAGPYVRLVFRDEGVGIPEEHLSRVFDPYFTTKSEGRGLGLAVCHSIVLRHGGHIRVESSPGAGTAFTVHLPASENGVHVRPAEAGAAPLRAGTRILVMDDEAAVTTTLRRMLLRLGAEVESAPDGTSALEAYLRARASGRPFALVISDLTVPGGMGGVEMVRRLRELDPQVKVLASSGYSNNPVLADPKAHGFCGVLNKPYRLKDVSAALDALPPDR